MRYNKARITMTLLTGMILWHLPCSSEVSLPKIFSDHMVLQRDADVAVWGWADPGETVRIEFDGDTYSTDADPQGHWLVNLSPHAAGGPFEMTVRGENVITIKDILIGDVWVCSGQSNMQWNIHQTGYTETDTMFIKQNRVRLFQVSIDWDILPRDDVKDGVWHTLGFDKIQFFSAVAYHFGKYMHQELDVPIGLVSSNLGATCLETWMSNEALSAFDQFRPDLEITRHGKNFAALEEAFQQIKPDWDENYYLKGPGIEERWYLPETPTSDWQTMTVPGYWEDNGLEGHDGAVWFRKSFDLPEGFDQAEFLLQLNQIDDYDITWVNGHQVGETYGRHNHRNYTIDAGLLQPEDNVLVVRVFDIGGKGGFTTNAFWGNPILLGDWQFKKGLEIDVATFPVYPTPNATPFSSPGVLYNANIAPLTQYQITGVIWYQGESNVERAYEYRDLFPAMIQDWRKQFGKPRMPFIFVQLANYFPEAPQPGESFWSELREAQAMALELPNTGMACAIDIGEADDIHPRNKEAVGKRLGMAALHVTGQKDVIPSGPMMRSVTFEHEHAIVTFDHTGDGLVCTDKYGYVRGFALAGPDKTYKWAQAKIVGSNQVMVQCDGIEHPEYLRYAWSENPGALTLYNSAGLPAVPFRTDDFPGTTAGVKYNHQDARF